MRILHVITTINRGGAENHLVDLVTGLLAAGAEVCVAYLKGDSYWTNKLASSGCLVVPLGLHRYGDVTPLVRLGKLMREFQPDIVHAHMPPAELYSRLAISIFGCSGRFVISKHNDEPFYPGLGHRLLGRLVLRGAKRVIAISGAVNAYVEANLSPFPGQVTTVHYGIDPASYRSIEPEVVSGVRADWKIPAGAHVIGTVARFVPQKALHVLLSAYADYRSRASRESRLVLVGRGPLESDLKQLAVSLGIEHAIVWAGFREDIQAVMCAFDCFALTSQYEGFGLVLLEAMAAGRPIVATAVSAIPEVVEDEVTGILCSKGDVEALSRAFSRLAEPELQSSFGNAGALRVEKRFSIDSMVRKTMSIYQECL